MSDLAVPSGDLKEEPEQPSSSKLEEMRSESHPQVIIPGVPVMTKQTYAASMSYVGSGRRATAFVRKVGTTPVKASLAWSGAALFLGVMWLMVLPVWYFVTIILFGWFMVPFRLVRRSHRKQEHIQKTQLATMQAMMVQQSQSVGQNRDSDQK